MMAEAEARTCETILEEASRSFLLDDSKFDEHNRVYAETFERLKSLKDAMRSMREKQGIHASELACTVLETESRGVLVTRRVFVPPQSYTCSLCFKTGTHFRDDCDKKEDEDQPTLLWGANKKFTDLRAKTDPGCLSRK
jgi:hypothetical protein